MRLTTSLIPVAALALAAAACGGGGSTRSTPSPSAPSTAPSGTQAAVPGGAGTQLWAQRYGVPGGQVNGVGQSVVVSPNGSRVYVTGSGGTLAYDAVNGTQLWTAATTAFAGSGGSTPPPTLAVTPDGTKVVVAGTAGARGGSGDYLTLAYDARTGKQLWSARYDGPSRTDDSARAVAVTPDGSTVVVNGISNGGASGPDLTTVAYSATNGAQRWVGRYDGTGHGEESLFGGGGQSLALSADGRTAYVTAGSKGTGQGHDYAVVAYDTRSGARRWASRWTPGGTTADSVATSVAVAGSRVLVTGGSGVGAKNGYDVATVAFDAANGSQQWVKTYNGPASKNDGAVAIGATPDGSKVFVTGTSEGATPGQEDYITLGYDVAKGDQLWAQRYSGDKNGDDNAASLAVSHDGSTVYVTGWSTGTSSTKDYATVAYAAGDGSRRWVGRYTAAGAGDNEARCVTASADGRVFVTGTAGGSYATVAYKG